MRKKLLVALTMEGKFAGEGLQNIDKDDDMLSAMARELVERNGIRESADGVWRALNTEHQKLFPGASPLIDNTCPLEEAGGFSAVQSDPVTFVEEAMTGDSVLIFGQRPGSALRRRRPRAAIPEQASLFSSS